MRFTPFPNDEQLSGQWEELGVGAPTVMAFARLCAQALASPSSADPPGLSLQAQAILYTARSRGLMELKAVNTAFESPERLLAVHVEREPERGIVFRSRSNPRWTISFLEGFRQLCAAGLVLHHLYREFSLSQKGYEVAESIVPQQVQPLIDQALEYG